MRYNNKNNPVYHEVCHIKLFVIVATGISCFYLSMLSTKTFYRNVIVHQLRRVTYEIYGSNNQIRRSRLNDVLFFGVRFGYQELLTSCYNSWTYVKFLIFQYVGVPL